MKALHKGALVYSVHNKYKVSLWVELESDHGIILMTYMYVQFKVHINIKQAVEYSEQDK